MNVKREGNPLEENISDAPSDQIFFEQLQGFALESQDFNGDMNWVHGKHLNKQNTKSTWNAMALNVWSLAPEDLWTTNSQHSSTESENALKPALKWMHFYRGFISTHVLLFSGSAL